MRRFAALFLLLPGLAHAQLHYTVTPEPTAQSIRVRLNLEAKGSSTEFRIPAWCPGYYVLQDYQKKISDVKVTDEKGNLLAIQNPDSRGWRVFAPAGTKLTLSYRVLGDEEGLGFFAVNVRPHTVFVNGPAAFMYPEGRLTEVVRVRFDLPEKWQVATAMDQSGEEWTADGYDELADHPIQLGKFERRSFTSEGIPMEAVFVSESDSFRPQMEEEVKQLAQLSRPAIKMMGGVPFKKFLYLIHLSIGSFSGGLEHRASTVLAVPNTSRLGLHELATHEFFHAWNVKQIRPKSLGPFDYTKKVREKDLWFSEGVTDYYAHRHSYQSGLRTADEMVRMLGDQIAELQDSGTRKSKTLEQAGLEAWEHGSMGTGDLSYYTKGSVAGLVFDAAIRSATGGEKSLDDVMRLLYARHKLPKPGFDENGILQAINEVSGTDMSALYKTVVQSTDEIPYDVLRKLGLRLRIPGQKALELGYSLNQGTVHAVDPDVARFGLKKGDRVLKVGERSFGPGCFAWVSRVESYPLEVFRDGKKLRLTLKPKAAKTESPVLEIDPFAEQMAAKLREGWLKRTEYTAPRETLARIVG